MIAPAKWHTRAAVLAALAGLCVMPAAAYNYWLWGSTPVTWPGGQSLRYLSASTFSPGSDPLNLYLSAMGLWMIVPSADFEYSYYPLTFDPQIDPYDGYNDTTAVDASELDPGVLVVSTIINDGASWYDIDTLFSDYPAPSGWTLETNPPCEVITQPAVYGYSFLLAATHELGITLGLALDPQGTEPSGTPWFIATMNPRYPSGGPIGSDAIVELHTDDRNGLRVLYPHSGSSVTVRDLANPGYTTGVPIGKALPSFFNPTSAYPAATLTLRGVIENFGNSHEFNVHQGFYLSDDKYIDSGDTLLGELAWDIPLGDGFDFDVEIDLPADWPAGTWHLGSILDDYDEVAEEYEDNNTHRYCQPLTIVQRAPAIEVLGQEIAACGTVYHGPAPTVTLPLNMAPLTWSLDNPEPGMTIDPWTGMITWPSPVRSPFPYALIVRATNDAGTDAEVLYLGVEQGIPALLPIAPRQTPHTQPYTGPLPVLTDPECMQPILNWSLDEGPAGLEIDHATGVVQWDRPRYAAEPYTICIRATNAVGNGSVTWRLTVTGQPGDLNCDDLVNAFDVDAFALALADPYYYYFTYPGCDSNLADINGDGFVNAFDIDPFIELLVEADLPD